MTRISVLLVALLLSLSVHPQTPPDVRDAPGQTSFSYQLPDAAHTSAGVFDETGHLVRTLWSGLPQEKGKHTATWDGLTDSGSRVAQASQYKIKVLANDVRYQWDGIIGNTEDTWTTSADIWDGIGYDPRNLRIICGDEHQRCWATEGYAEGTSNLAWLMPDKPNTPHEINPDYRNQNVNFVDGDSDTESLYLTNAGAWSGGGFTIKLQKDTGVTQRFALGNQLKAATGWMGMSLSAIDQTPAKSPNAPTAIAVQDTGQILAVSHKGACEIRFFDKTTGTSFGRPVENLCVDSMGFTSDGLWVLSAGHVSLIRQPAGNSTVSQPLGGLSHPVSLATNKRLNRIVVLDGGASQQVKEFDSSGKLVRTYGRVGGYLDWNPTITQDRLMADDLAITGQANVNHSWVKVSPSDEIWICDGGNAGRILHISSKNKFLDEIQFSQETYSLAISRSEPTRMFRGSLEYRINYKRPLRPGRPSALSADDRSWDLIRNWAVGAFGAHGSSAKPFTSAFEKGFVVVERLSNQRTYGELSDIAGNWWEVELPKSGDQPLRFTGQMFKKGNGKMYQQNGDLAFVSVKRDNPTVYETEILENHIIGFDTWGNPLRSVLPDVAVKVAYSPDREPPLGRGGWGMGPYLNPTSNGTYPAYRSTPYTEGAESNLPHLAGARLGDDTYLFSVHREKCISRPDYVGSFPCRSGYGGHAGMGAQALGPFVFTAYDGQYASWGNTFCQYSEDGLFIGQFGEFSPGRRGEPLGAGLGGNFAVARFVQVDDKIYLYLTSEAGHAPAQRWSISNLSSVVTMQGFVRPGGGATLH